TGEHAPGRGSLADSLAASHHVLLAHGLATQRIREVRSDALVGITLNFTPAVRTTDAPAAVDRFEIVDDLENWWYIEPIAGHGYAQRPTERLGWQQREVLEGDLATIAQPLDFLGINFYTRKLLGAVEGEKHPRGPESAMGWEVHPDSLGWLLRTLHERYPLPSYYITENGAAMADTVRREGRIVDLDRIEYVRAHLQQVLGAIGDGMPIEGYFMWSLLDNFEWAHGYKYRFGIVEVDPVTFERTPKHSADWYAQVARTGRLDSSLNGQHSNNGGGDSS